MTATLVTGASGFIAQHVASVLRRTSGDRLIGVDVRPSPGATFDAFQIADLTDSAATLRAIETSAPDTVYHLAGAIRGSDAVVHASNVETARNVLEAVRKVAPKARVVLVGSAAEYGVVPIADQPVLETAARSPTGAYGRAKLEVTALATAAARDFGQQVTVARPFNVMGAGVPETMVAGAIVHRLRAALLGPSPRTITIGRTSAIRDFVDIEDVVTGLVCVAEHGRAGQAYNLCSGEGHAIQEVLDQLIALANEPVVVTRDETLLRGGDVDVMIGSREKAERELGWRPRVSFHDSVRNTWEGLGPMSGQRFTR